jgi:hypothetical protein
MKWSDLPLRPDDRTLRQFAGLWIVFFGGIAAYQTLVHERTTLGIVLAVVALTVGLLGLVQPRAIKPVFVAWIVAAFPIGWTISLVVLALLYFLVFTPLALAFRLFGRDPLGLRRRSDRETYWIPKPAIEPARYFRTY